MKKPKNYSQQKTLFRRDVPQMAEGYYSSGPNPNLRRFVEEHAKPYDPATDSYDIPPYDQPITTTKATAIYNMHTYWSKKPYDAIRQYIRHYTQPGDLVLDPFSGSGGAALAALMEGRAAIAIDLSPAATFITKNYCTPVNEDELQRAYNELERKIKPEMDWLYETRCDRCDGHAATAYIVYSYVFQCPRCLEKVSLFDCLEVQSQTAAGKLKAIRICPYCQKRGHEEEIKTSGARFDPIPVLVSYLCEEGCKPQRAERLHNDPDPKKHEYFLQYDLGKIREIESKPIPYWFPSHRMMNVESDTEPWGDKWRAGTSSFRTVSELFTKRNLWALAILLERVKETKNINAQEKLLFCFSAMCLFVSKMHQDNSGTGGNITKGTYYIPQIYKDMQVWDSFSRKWTTVYNGNHEQVDANLSQKIVISTEDATKIPIRTGSIEYIFTDPPYGGNIQYGELNFVWEAWLGFETNWHSKEIVINNTRNISDENWASMMHRAMAECYRALKPGRWISICYHDTSEGTWQFLQDMMAEIGFIPEKSDAALFIDTSQKTFNQLMAEKVTKRDLVINFRKPRPDELAPSPIFTGDEDSASFIEKARLLLSESLEAHPGGTADRLYDELVSRMVRRGEFERHNFDDLLRSVAEEANGRWYLLETAGQVDEAESKKETAAAKRLEDYMQKVLSEQRNVIGIHYSDLFEQYLPIKDKPRRMLQDWLPEFFFKTIDGTWRSPANEEERQQKAVLRSSGALRRIKRFTNALVDGVPPADRDRPENAITLTDWIRQCRRAGLYDLGRALYEKGGLHFDELSEETQLQVDEDYQICVVRSANTNSTRKHSANTLPQIRFDV